MPEGAAATAAATAAAALLLASGGAAAAGAQNPPAAVRAGFAESAIRLDGVPDEPVWLTSDSISDFRQQDPEEGAPASERTVVRFLYTREGLYVGLWAYDREPHRIVRSLLRRDADPEPDDFIALVLDPQRDRRSAYAFSVNPNGAIADGEVKSREDVDFDWDGVWDARARIGPDGWTAELFIPWQTLRYPAGNAEWGVNVYRQIRRKNEEVLWQAWRRQQGLFYLEGEGLLLGLEDLPRRRLAELRPYALGQSLTDSRDFRPDGSDSVTAAGRAELKAGGDLKLAVAPTLSLDLTANTDFAQVEADRQVVNLTRFPLFFPEKRQFFLEAAGTFEFGQPERTLLFHSRRIGLAADGSPLSIVAGARLAGRVGRERIGLLAVRTGGDEDALDLVARVKHDVLERGYVGAILTAQDGPGVSARRLAAGVDFSLPLLRGDQNIVPAAFIAWTQNGAGAPVASAWRLYLDYPNDNVDHFVSVSRLEEGFDPALGFVRQDGVWRAQGALRFFPRPGRWGIRRLRLTALELDLTTTLDRDLDNASYGVRPLGVELNSGDEFDLSVRRFSDAPSESFELFPGADIAPGRYHWNRVELDIETSSARAVSGELTVSAGGYYTGRSAAVEGALTVRLAPHLIAGAGYERTAVRLAAARFTAQAANARLDLAATPRLNATLFLQWDNESERMTLNARLHWIPRPGSDAYLVWNGGWPTGLAGGVPWRRPLSRALVGKVVWYLRP